MAAIPKPVVGGLNIEAPAPAGVHSAVCVKVIDLFGVERTKFQSQEKEMQDVTRFVFGVRDQAGTLYLVATYEFKISGASNSNLVEFLTSWMGRAPQAGWDYCELEGAPAQITVAARVGKQNNAPYSVITNISPLHPQLASTCPNAAEFAGLLAHAMAGPGDSPPPAQGAPPAQHPPAQGAPPAQHPPAQGAPPAQHPPAQIHPNPGFGQSQEYPF